MATSGTEPTAKKGLLDSLIDAAFSVGNAVMAPFSKSEKVKLPDAKIDLKLPLPKIIPSFGKPYLVAAAEAYDDLQWQYAISQYSPEALTAALSEKLFHQNDTLIAVAARSEVPGLFTKILKLHSKEEQITLLKHHHFEDINALFSAIGRPAFDEVLSHYISAEKEGFVEIPIQTIFKIISLQYDKNLVKDLKRMLQLNVSKKLIFEVINKLRLYSTGYEYNFEHYCNKHQLEQVAFLNFVIDLKIPCDVKDEHGSTPFQRIMECIQECIDYEIREKLVDSARKLIARGVIMHDAIVDPAKIEVIPSILHNEQTAFYYRNAYLLKQKPANLPQNNLLGHLEKVKFTHDTYILSCVHSLADSLKLFLGEKTNEKYYKTVLEKIVILHTFIKSSPSLDAVDFEEGKTVFENIRSLLIQLQNIGQYRSDYHKSEKLDNAHKKRMIFLKLQKLQYVLIAHGAHMKKTEGVINAVEDSLYSDVINHHRLAGLMCGKLGLPVSLACKVGEFLVKPDLLVHFRSGAKAAYVPKRVNCLTYQEEDTSMNLYAKKAAKDDETGKVNPKNRKRKRD